MTERVLDRLMVVVAAAVVGVLVFGIVLALAASGPSPHAVATDVLAAARNGVDGVAERLPDGGAALVHLPAGTFEISEKTQQTPAAVLPWLDSHAGASAVARGDDGSWAAVSLPENGSAVPAGLVAALVAVIGVLAVPLLGNRHPQAVVHITQPDPRILEQRAALVGGLVDLLPQLPEAVAWQAENTLTQAGVRQVVPDGEFVDPKRHHVVGTELPPDVARVNTVARTIRPGYVDGNRFVTHPKVVVYTQAAR
jgi:hypothetical protein